MSSIIMIHINHSRMISCDTVPSASRFQANAPRWVSHSSRPFRSTYQIQQWILSSRGHGEWYGASLDTIARNKSWNPNFHLLEFVTGTASSEESSFHYRFAIMWGGKSDCRNGWNNPRFCSPLTFYKYRTGSQNDGCFTSFLWVHQKFTAHHCV